jgi:5-methylcytosine-specific restriction protein B
MEIINEKKYSERTYGCEIDVTVDEWKDILTNNELTTENYTNALLAFYKEPKHHATCKDMGAKYFPDSTGAQKFNAWITNFGRAVIKHLNRFIIHSDKGEPSYWNVAMNPGIALKNDGFQWTMRPELVQAISELELESHFTLKPVLEQIDENLKLLANNKLIKIALNQYLDDLDTNWDKEDYKWVAVKCFQSNWDENKSGADFATMLESALSKTGNLLSSTASFPRGMINNFAKADPEETKKMFLDLFNENENLDIRYQKFIEKAEELRNKYNDGTWNNHYQNTNVVSVYLWLRYPEKYYIYKYSEYKAVDEKFGLDIYFKANGAVTEMLKGFKLYDYLNPILRNNTKLVSALRNKFAQSESYYDDTELRTATFDFGFWVSRYFDPSKVIIPKMSPFIKEASDLLHYKKNIILQGAPGTGKTYNTAALALAIIDGIVPEDHAEVMERYEELRSKHRIEFTTFHQSMDYEDFVEGLKPIKDGNNVIYDVEDGIFKVICNAAQTATDVTTSGTDEVLAGINDNPTIWKVSLESTGDNPTRTDCLENGHIRIGWAQYKDVDFMDAEDITDGKNILRAFQHDMAIGDIVVSCYSQDETDAIGIVTGDYEYHEDGGAFPRYREVRWIVKNIKENIKDINGGKHMTLGTVYRLSISLNDIINVIKKYSTSTNSLQVKSERPYVLIIDEINRGNVSRIFGELITLLEPDKRIGEVHAIKLKLPYTKNEDFGVPNNLYIIGTMNTTDRSTGTIDYALRRRFAFITLPANPDIIKNETAKAIFNNVKDFIKQYQCADMDIDDLMVGHSYFMASSDSELKQKIIYEVIPLVKEYIKDGILSVRPEEAAKWFNAWKNLTIKGQSDDPTE